MTKTRTETDAAARKEAVCEAQRWLQDDATILPVMVSQFFYVVDAKVKDGVYSSYIGLNLQNAYLANQP